MQSISMGPGAFRFLLAMMVVVEHVSRLKIGTPAVMAFFILSGYWVTRVYCERYALAPRSLSVFYTARFLRIWPLFAVVLGLTVLALAFLGHPLGAETLAALPIFGIASHGIDPIGVSWSLDIELQFYLIVPLIALLSADMDGPAKRALLLVLALGLWMLGLAMARFWGIETALRYLPMFLAGVAIYRFDWRSSRMLAWASVGLFGLVLIWAVKIPEIRDYILHGTDDRFLDHSFAMLWAIYLVPFIAYNVRRPSSRFDRHLGNLSYTLYLVHFPVLLIARTLGHGALSDIERLALMALSVAVSVVIYVLIEQPLERLRQHIAAAMATGPMQSER